MPRLKFFLLLILSIGFLSLQVSATGEIHAVVVGIDNYPGIEQSQDSCVNDANAFAAELQKRGVKPTVLLNEQATRENIIKSLKAGKNTENVVFYYSGLGSGPSTPRLLTHENKRGLTLEELDETLTSLKADSVTAILDSCFTGTREAKDGPTLFASRYYKPESPSSRSLEKLGADTASIPGVSHDKVCYITASRFNEEAYADTFEGRPQGVFTYFFCKRLNKGDNVAWRAIQWDVSAKVAAHVIDQQHPEFPQQFLAQGLGEGPGEGFAGHQRPDKAVGGPQNPETASAGPVNPDGDSLWNLFNIDNDKGNAVKVTMRPNQSEVKIRQPLEFRVNVGNKGGYLLVVEHSVEGTLQPIFPRDGKINSALVRPNSTVIIPDANTIAYADSAGRERIKAFLFGDEKMANELLSALSVKPTEYEGGAPTFGAVSRELQARSIVFEPNFGSRGVELKSEVIPYTSALTFQVVSPTVNP